MLGTRGQFIVGITHCLVVERSLPFKLKAYAEKSFAANSLLLGGVLAIHPVFNLASQLSGTNYPLSLVSSKSCNILKQNDRTHLSESLGLTQYFY